MSDKIAPGRVVGARTGPERDFEELRDLLKAFDRRVDELEAAHRQAASDVTPAAAAFMDVVRETLGDEARLTPEAARRGALLAVAAQAWDDALDGLLDSKDVRTLLGLGSRQAVDARLKGHALIGLQERSGRWKFPAFQFREGEVDDALVSAFWTVAPSAEPWTAASWCVSPNDDLDGLSPRDWARTRDDAARLDLVAERDAARLAR